MGALPSSPAAPSDTGSDSAMADASVPRDMPWHIVHLPPPLLECIVAFAAVDDLPRLAHVSRACHAFVRHVASARELRTFTVDANTITTALSCHSALLALRCQLTARREFLRVLHVDVGATAVSAEQWRKLWGTAVHQVETLSIRIKHHGAVLSDVRLLDAVARLCPKATSLTIVSPARDEAATTTTADAMLVALNGCLARWHTRGGLRRVCVAVPYLRLDNHATRATQFLTTLATTCPNLERLGSSTDHTINDKKVRIRPRVTDEQWHIDLATWEVFCASCRQLMAFDWSAVPFATSFFEVFARYPKPKLTCLTFNPPVNWDWDAYHRHQPTLRSVGFGATAMNPQTMFQACPSLRELRILILTRRGMPQDTIVSPSLFGDAFYEAVATHCRQLEQFEVVACIRTLSSGPVASAEHCTDAALVALATLPMLTRVVILMPTSITGSGLLQFVRSSATQRAWSRPCDYTIMVGASEEHPFNEIVKLFLERLAGWASESSVSVWNRLKLRLVNGHDTRATDEFRFLTWFLTLSQLVDVARETHARSGAALRLGIKVQCTLHDRTVSGPLFDSVRAITFFTTNAPRPPPVYKGQQEPSFDRVDVCRPGASFVGSDDDDSDDIDDVEDNEDNEDNEDSEDNDDSDDSDDNDDSDGGSDEEMD